MYKSILYITYDGLTDPLGQSQVIPYLTGLSNEGYNITILSCEKKQNFSKNHHLINSILSKNKISWEYIEYTKSPPIFSTIWDIYNYKKVVLKLFRKHNFNIVHCRSYISSLIGIWIKKKWGTKFIFDMRGFYADERVDGKIWNRNNPLFDIVYKYFKKKELEFLSKADYTISLTMNGKNEIHKWGKIPTQPIPLEVIPCCADLNHFSPKNTSSDKINQLKTKLRINENDFVISYLGSIGTWYMLTEMLDFFKVLLKQKPNSKYLYITQEDPDLIISDSSKSLNQSVITPWAGSSSPYYAQTIKSLARAYKISLNTPFQELEKNIQDSILWGSGEKIIRMTYSDGENKYSIERPFEGVIPNMERRYRETSSSWVRDELARFQSPTDCQTCNGMRLKPESLAVKIADLNISLLTKKSISEARNWIENLPIFLSETQNEIASRFLKEINERLQFLIDVGLEYLTLSRSSRTLSGGESQRIRLASQIGSGLTGVLYVLDEPSIGLHQRDNTRLLDTLRRLRDLGNTVVVVEHDEEAIRCADFLVDLGPGAGAKGGKIIASGSPKKILKNKESLTARYLRGELEIKIPIERKKGNGKKITLKSATANNLNNIDVDFPLGTFTCITGVSGSGKSTLVLDTLYKILARKLHNAREVPGTHVGISGIECIDKVVDIDQSPIGRTPRSNPATYTGTFTPIREWYSGLPEARARGYKPGRFSFNVKGGRCEACQGDGVIKIEMHFLPDVYVKCDVCKGSRYNRETLEILFKNNTISDVLNMSVDEGHEFFKAVPSIREKLSMLKRVGLGYIQIGQQATTLSGGEAQRIKLSKELARRATGKTLYILDEPTTGLHFEDIKNLLNVLHALVEQGNTVIVIEHNLEVIKTADWIIDLGPDGGNKGGKIIAIGTPEEVSKHSVSYTGQYLATYFNDKSKKQLQKVF